MFDEKRPGVDNTGAYIGAISGLISTGINAGMTFYENKQADKRQAAAQALSLKLARAQDIYNLPINQARRLREAGLNPAMFMGAPSDAVSAEVVEPSRHEIPRVDLSSIASAMVSYNLESRRLDLEEAKLEENKRQFDSLQGLNGLDSASLRSTEVRTQLLSQQYRFRQSVERLDYLSNSERLRGLQLDNDYKKALGDLKVAHERLSNKIQSSTADYLIDDARLRNAILSDKSKMSKTDLALYDEVSALDLSLKRLGVQGSEIRNVIAETDLRLRNSQLEKLQFDIRNAAAKAEYNEAKSATFDAIFEGVGTVLESLAGASDVFKRIYDIYKVVSRDRRARKARKKLEEK